MPPSCPRRLIVGCGYLGTVVARMWLAEGAAVLATTRSNERAEQLRAIGAEPFVCDLHYSDSVSSLSSLRNLDTVLYCVGSDRLTTDKRDLYVNGLSSALANLSIDGRLIYTSSTGVYGDFQGGWVSENSPTDPEDEGGRICLEAESVLWCRAAERNIPTVVLRLAGLYGPGRVIGREALLAGRPIEAHPDVYVNLIHVSDAAAAVEAARLRAAPGQTYIVADGHPVRRRDYYAEVARLLAAPFPAFRADSASRRRGDRRISNSRMCSELGVTCAFPDYKAGLHALLNTHDAARQ